MQASLDFLALRQPLAMIVSPCVCLQARGNDYEPIGNDRELADGRIRHDCEPYLPRVCKPGSYFLQAATVILHGWVNLLLLRVAFRRSRFAPQGRMCEFGAQRH